MQTQKSYQFVELSQNELINISGGNEYCVICGLKQVLPSAEVTLGAQNFELIPNDYVLKTTDEGYSVSISGFLGVELAPPSGPLWRMG